MLTARATSTAITMRDSADCSIMRTFAGRDNTMVSVGLKAVLVLKARNR
jgi:hypothetical protein